jgi:hypothetical protein
LSRDPAERPSVADLLAHPYLAGCEEHARQETEREAEQVRKILETSVEGNGDGGEDFDVSDLKMVKTSSQAKSTPVTSNYFRR